jgi:hypothetical protein
MYQSKFQAIKIQNLLERSEKILQTPDAPSSCRPRHRRCHPRVVLHFVISPSSSLSIMPLGVGVVIPPSSGHGGWRRCPSLLSPRRSPPVDPPSRHSPPPASSSLSTLVPPSSCSPLLLSSPSCQFVIKHPRSPFPSFPPLIVPPSHRSHLWSFPLPVVPPSRCSPFLLFPLPVVPPFSLSSPSCQFVVEHPRSPCEQGLAVVGGKWWLGVFIVIGSN